MCGKFSCQTLSYESLFSSLTRNGRIYLSKITSFLRCFLSKHFNRFQTNSHRDPLTMANSFTSDIPTSYGHQCFANVTRNNFLADRDFCVLPVYDPETRKKVHELLETHLPWISKLSAHLSNFDCHEKTRLYC